MISNSSPLIFLAKINQLHLLKKLFKSVTISDSVRDEILIRERPKVLSEAIKKEWIKIENPKRELNLGLGRGESSVINLARERDDGLIIDDALGVKVARSFGINVLRTTTILLRAVKNKLLEKKETIKLIDKLLGEGYYIAPKYYAEILRGLSS